MKKRLIKYSVFMLLLLVICIVINKDRGNDFAVRFLEMEDLYPVKAMEEYLTKEMDDYPNKEVIAITKEKPTSYRGKVNTGPNLALEKGKYAFAIKYKTNSPNNYFVIGESTKLNKDGTVGVVYAKQMMPIDENRIRVEFILEENINGLEITIFYEGGELELSGVDMHIMDGYSDTLLLSILLFLFVGIVGFFLYIYQAGKIWWKYGGELFMLTLIVGFSMLPYLNDFMISGHDLQFHLARVEGTYRALQNGIFPVRINPIQNSGYGYASPVTYPQLFLYIPAVLRLFGMSLLNSYKILLLLVNVLTVGLAYFSFYKLLHSRYGALIGTAFYTLCLYRLTNLFVRGALGETIAMAALPLVIYGMYEIIWGEKKRWYFAVLGFTIVLQSHILSTVLYGGTTFLFCVVFIWKFFKEKRRILSLLKAAGMTVLLNLWYLIPFLDYMRLPLELGKNDEYVLGDRTVYFSQIFSNAVSAVGNNKERGSTVGEMPLTVGLLLLLGAILFFLLGRNKERLKQNEVLQKLYFAGRVSLLVSGIALFLSSWLFPWQLASRSKLLEFFIGNIQFFWRFLSIASIALCFVSAIAGCMLIYLYPACARVISYGAVILAVLFCSFLVDQTLQASSIGSAADIANETMTDYLYLYDNQHYKMLQERGESVTLSMGTDAVCTDFRKTGTNVSFHVSMVTRRSDSYLEVPIYGYPGYHAYWNDTELPVSVGETGELRISLPSSGEEGDLKVQFEEPFFWKAGNLISLVTLLAVFLFAGILRYRELVTENRNIAK